MNQRAQFHTPLAYHVVLVIASMVIATMVVGIENVWAVLLTYGGIAAGLVLLTFIMDNLKDMTVANSGGENGT